MDASVGLTFSLQLFQRYRRNGILQATIRHMPGIQGACTAYVHLTAGSVTACYLENKHGQQIPYPIDDLCRVDHDRGPFEWIFQPQQTSSSAQTTPAPAADAPVYPSSAPSDLEVLVPRAVASLRWEQFNHWTPEQKVLLQQVWKFIDGRHTVQEIKASLAYPPQMVHEVIQVLFTSHLIVFAS